LIEPSAISLSRRSATERASVLWATGAIFIRRILWFSGQTTKPITV
jgi:hypothetical protein